ncbi:hypothetical protein CN071_27835 [Sinorhizobium meliloti]|uniref:hypothetical protein n=1 Tax=Rhizobium meliloti TaxID=382 RepID=UPI000FDBA13C|nr:hypothetical protein [Sinorhizobium meliloti]RVP57115.1 hypothetical protein CN071_27835 [Sinorhizobium meliloti]
MITRNIIITSALLFAHGALAEETRTVKSYITNSARNVGAVVAIFNIADTLSQTNAYIEKARGEALFCAPAVGPVELDRQYATAALTYIANNPQAGELKVQHVPKVMLMAMIAAYPCE